METLPERAAAKLARHYDLRAGEQVTGIVVRLPQHGAYLGNSLLLGLDGGDLVALEATAKRGYTVFERELQRAAVRTGDQIRITFVRWAVSAGGNSYRDFRVERLAAAENLEVAA
jgi:hypothetical protein